MRERAMAPNDQGTVSEEVSVFLQEVSGELAQQEGMLAVVQNEEGYQFLRSIISLVLLLMVSAMIIIRPYALLIWLIVGLLLYSYNFVILFLPTTTGRPRPKRKPRPRDTDADHRWLAIKLLLRKRMLAVEMGLTIFLGGMVPLTLSFTVILGLGLILLGYFLSTAYVLADGLALLVVAQVSLIIFFYILMNILRPQAQGITLFAKAWKVRIGLARSRGWAATTMVMILVLGLVTISAILFIGALILPGVTLASLFSSLGRITVLDLLMGIFILATQLWVMRTFQSFTSRRMALKLLGARVGKLKELLTQAEILSSIETNPDRAGRFQAIRSEFYAMMVYDIIRLDFFGHAPVYLVGPRLKYVLDDNVIAQIPG